MPSLETQAPQAGQVSLNNTLGLYQSDYGSSVRSAGNKLGSLVASLAPGSTRSPTEVDLFDPVTDRALTEDGIPEDPEFTKYIQKEASRLEKAYNITGQGDRDRLRAVVIGRRLKYLNPARALQIESTFKLNQKKTLQELERDLLSDVQSAQEAEEDRIRQVAKELNLPVDAPVEDLKPQINARLERARNLSDAQQELELLKTSDETTELMYRRSVRRNVDALVSSITDVYTMAVGDQPIESLSLEQREQLAAKVDEFYVQELSRLAPGYSSESAFNSDIAALTVVKDKLLGQITGSAKQTRLDTLAEATLSAHRARLFDRYPDFAGQVTLLGEVADVIRDAAPGMTDAQKRVLMAPVLELFTQTFFGAVNASTSSDLTAKPVIDQDEAIRNIKWAAKAVENSFLPEQERAQALSDILNNPNGSATLTYLDKIMTGPRGDRVKFMHSALMLMANENVHEVLNKSLSTATPSVASKWLESYKDYKEAVRESANEVIFEELNRIEALSSIRGSAFLAEAAAMGGDFIGDILNAEDSRLVDYKNGELGMSDDFLKIRQEVSPEIREQMDAAMATVLTRFRENNYYIRKADKLWGKDVEIPAVISAAERLEQERKRRLEEEQQIEVRITDG